MTVILKDSKQGRKTVYLQEKYRILYMSEKGRVFSDSLKKYEDRKSSFIKNDRKVFWRAKEKTERKQGE